MKESFEKLGIKGSIYLSTEGINFHISSNENNCHEAKVIAENILNTTFDNAKIYPVCDIPYTKLIVRIRKEIVSIGALHTKINENQKISPLDLDNLYSNNKDFTILDTRNNNEIKFGTFKNAKNLNINNFRELPKAINSVKINKSNPMVIFCTGGIRCEKVAPILQKQNFTNVMLLDGGILNYFKHSSKNYDGGCFVFDDRVAINQNFSVIENAKKEEQLWI